MIYNRQTIALLMRLCRLVSTEYGVRLHLDDPEIINKLSKILSSEASAECLSVWRAVRDEIGLEMMPATEEMRSRVYRGQTVEVASPAHVAASEPAPRPRSVRIYRGRVVTG